MILKKSSLKVSVGVVNIAYVYVYMIKPVLNSGTEVRLELKGETVESLKPT